MRSPGGASRVRKRGVTTLVVTEQGCRLAIKGGELLVRKSGEEIRRMRIDDVDHVMLLGSVELTSGAIRACLRKSIPVSFLTLKGSYRGRLVGRPTKHAPLRLAQYGAASDPGRCLELARAFVRGKVTSQRRRLLRAQRLLRDPALTRAIGGQRRVLQSIGGCANHGKLLGLEGHAAALYFGVFGKLIRNPAFPFPRRSRRPPADALNACLSFGYVMLGIVVEDLVLAAGLEPLIGFFHQPRYGRPSLALDLLEEFRPTIVDAVVLRLVNRGSLSPRDFENVARVDDEDPLAAAGSEPDNSVVAKSTKRPPAIHLNETGRRILLRELFGNLRRRVRYGPRGESVTYRDVIRGQVQAVARCVKDPDARYEPFAPR